jgi:hypothetical protein
VQAFVRIGLSQDHHFASKILRSITASAGEVSDADIEVKLRDFITIFKNDEVSDNVIKKINEEVN